MPASVPPPISAEEIPYLDLPGKSTELVRGQLIVGEPPSTRHGGISARMTYLIAKHVFAERLGEVFGQDTGFHIASNPDTVRAPDVAFVHRDRTALIPARGYARLAPDLVVELISPDDRPGELLAKVGDWLDGGSHIVWVIDPARREARIHRDDGSVAIVRAHEELDGEMVVPGFRCGLQEVLARE